MTQKHQWTAADIQNLRAGARNGMSAADICNSLGHRNLTRHAVIGKAHRLGIRLNGKPRNAYTLKRYATGIIDSSLCQYPQGEPHNSDFSFCGEPVYKSYSYCRAHCETCYTNFEKGDPTDD